MGNGDQDQLKSEEFEKFFAEQERAKSGEARSGSVRLGQTETGSVRLSQSVTIQAGDGRLSSKTDRQGFVQLNVRVPVDVKNSVLAERLRRKQAGEPASDVSDIVCLALRLFLQKS